MLFRSDSPAELDVKTISKSEGVDMTMKVTVTPEDIRELAPIIRAVLSEQSICAIGNAEKVKANQDLFKTVKNLFN